MQEYLGPLRQLVQGTVHATQQFHFFPGLPPCRLPLLLGLLILPVGLLGAGAGTNVLLDAAATDPVCRFSPHHHRVVEAREPARNGDELVYRTMKRPKVPERG